MIDSENSGWHKQVPAQPLLDRPTSALTQAPSLPGVGAGQGAALRQALHLRPLLLLGLLLALLGVFLLSLMLGSVDIPLSQVISILTGGEADKSAWETIVLKFRLPKALTAMLAGAALAVSGLQMQTFFRNPLADSFVLGISAGAGLGVALVVLSTGTVGGAMLTALSPTGDFAIAAAASLGSGLVMLLMMGLARQVASRVTLLIVGLMFGYLTNALVSLLLYFSLAERVQSYVNWTFGSFSGVSWGQMPIFAAMIVAGLLLAGGSAKALNALLLGDTYARSMGLNLRMAKLLIISATALLAGTVTAFCGPVGFIGLAVPHLCRGLFSTTDHRMLLPASALLGALVALLAALLAEMPQTRLVLPLNAVTAFMGAPVVLWVVLRGHRQQRDFSL